MPQRWFALPLLWFWSPNSLQFTMNSSRLQPSSRRPRHPGLGHWRWQRASAILLVPLILWTLWLSLSLDVHTYASARTWVDGAGPTIALILLAPVWYLHGALGLQTIIEDYVRPPLRVLLIWLVRLGAAILAAATVLATLVSA